MRFEAGAGEKRSARSDRQRFRHLSLGKAFKRPAGAHAEGKLLNERIPFFLRHGFETRDAGGGNHGAVVSAEAHGREVDLPAAALHFLREPLAELPVGGDAPRNDDVVEARHLDGAHELRGENVDERVDEPAGKVGPEDFILRVRGVRYRREDRGLEAREAHHEVGRMNHRARELNRAGRSLLGEGRDGGAARIGEAEELSGLVEGFARGVVKRFA